MKKRVYITVIALLLMAMLTGCYSAGPLPHAYTGPDGDLNSEVTNSILGIYGVDYNRIAVIREDSFGRRLFAYWGRTNAAGSALMGNDWINAFLIIQKSDDKYVYFYSGNNFIMYKDDPNREVSPTEEEWIRIANDPAKANDIEWLKQMNDWDKPFDESRLTRVLISQQDLERASNFKLVPDEAKEKARKQIAALNDSSRGAFMYLTSDEYDRHIFFYRVLDKDDIYTKSYVVLFNKDGSFDAENGIMEIKDVWNYQDDLKAFKERNGWNTPYVS